MPIFPDMAKLSDVVEYSPYVAYGQTKLANILHAIELQRRLEEEDVNNIKCNAVHPGGVSTSLIKSSNSALVPTFMEPVMSYFMTPVSQGVLTQLYAATSHDIDSKNIKAEYLVPVAQIGDRTSQAKDTELAKKLWTWSEKLIQEKGFSLTL
jgi:NAD(P)-dependent dehydrogenase (short-subunit alcohol dehydrogenase family)